MGMEQELSALIVLAKAVLVLRGHKANITMTPGGKYGRANWLQAREGECMSNLFLCPGYVLLPTLMIL